MTHNPNLGAVRRRTADKIEALENEIDWNIGRLANLILSDTDREQIEDMVIDLRQECDDLKRLNNVN